MSGTEDLFDKQEERTGLACGRWNLRKAPAVDEERLFHVPDLPVPVKEPVRPYDGVWEECWRCEASISVCWPHTRLCVPCRAQGWYEFDKVLYHPGKDRHWTVTN